MEGSTPSDTADTQPPLHLAADDREMHSGVYQRLMAMADICLETRRLITGDYEVEGRWVFERKTVQDFALSVVDGRLFRQAHRMAQAPEGRALILEGNENEVTSISREAWRGALIALSLTFQLPVLRSEDCAETVQLLRYAACQARRQREFVCVSTRPRVRTLERQRLRVLAALPGVGAHRARLLLDYFGSIEAVVSAEEAEMISVRGIGAHTAKQIRRIVSAGPRVG